MADRNKQRPRHRRILGEHCGINWNAQPLGKGSDRGLARRLDCSHTAVAKARKARCRSIGPTPPDPEWTGIGPEPPPEWLALFICHWIESELLVTRRRGKTIPPAEPTMERRARAPRGWTFPVDHHRRYTTRSVFAFRCTGARRWYDPGTGERLARRGRPTSPVLDDMVAVAVDEWPSLSLAEVTDHLRTMVEIELLAVFGKRFRAARADPRWQRRMESRHPHWFPLEKRCRYLLEVVSGDDFARRLERRAKHFAESRT